MIRYEIPIVSFTVPGVGEIPVGGLIVVIGPNSSGKTQLLRDISSRVTGQTRELVVCETIRLRKPRNFEAFVQCLIEHGAIKRTDTGGVTRLESAVPHFGTGGGPGDVSLNEAQGWYDSFSAGGDARLTAADNQRFLHYFGPLLSTVLFLENRLTATNQTGSFDYLGQKPANDIQALHLNSGAREKLKAEVRSTFGKALGIDPTRGGILALRISDLPEPPPLDWISPDKVSKLRGIDSEGDGIRSYCAVCIALLLGVRPVCLIDEPEICLHPPQAHALGRFIGEYGTPTEIATLVATHSSQVLRGILETGDNLRIVRLVRVGGRFIGRLVDSELIRASLKRPAARSEVILDGVFADAVTIVEADGDRVAYQTAFELLGPRPARRDNYFAAVGGVGGMPETARFYRTLHIPVAVIADLDLILDPPGLGRIIKALASDARATELAEKCDGLIRDIRKIPPDLTEKEISRRIGDLAAKQFSWAKNDDESLVRGLRQLANAIDRVRKLKSDGVAAFSEHTKLKARLENVIEECNAAGLFLVPVGELEHWSPELMKEGPGRERKAEWTNEFVKRMRQEPDRAGDIIDFVAAVDSFHGKVAEKLAAGV